MKKLFVVLIMIASSTAFADGFVCSTLEGDLDIQVYNHVNPADGTRSPAVMVISDPSVEHGHRSIARFTDENGTLYAAYDSYGQYAVVGNVDLRFSDTGRAGELISGTKLGEIDALSLVVDFNYGEELLDGESVTSLLTIYLRRGDVFDRTLICTRYLKNM